MLRRLALPILLALGWPVLANAQAPASQSEAARTPIELRAEEVVALLNGDGAPEDLFSKSFLAAIPPAQIRAVSEGITSQFGPAVSATLTPRDGTRAALEIRLERGVAKGAIAIDPAEENRITELRFGEIDSLPIEGDTAEKIAADLAALPGTVGAWFSPVGEAQPIVSMGPQKPLALGSAVKLYVLAALAEDVRQGKRRWSDVVPLDQLSYPSGRLQDWPQGAPLTLHTLASLMISISDNTATDQLIALLGRDRIVQVMRDSGHGAPALNDPLITTREFFVLKAGDSAQADAWRKGDKAARMAILEQIATQKPTLDEVNAAFSAGPRAIDIEYFASPVDLARLYPHMILNADPEAFRIMAINPSATPAIRAKWDYIGFKGGSEPGVLNLTWFLRDKAGRPYVLSLGWNNPAASVDEGKLEAIAQRILLLPR